MYVLFYHVIYGCFVFIFICIYVFVLSCYIWMFCMYIHMYLCICIFVCVYIYLYVNSCTYMLVSMYVFLYTFVRIKVICLSCRYLGCYLLIWHCYLGSILAFSFKFQNLNLTICTKASNKST